MQGRKRVYPSSNGKWMSGALLIVSAALLLSGLIWRDAEPLLSISPVPSATAIPLDEGFDDTLGQREITLPSATWYALQLGAFESEKAAAELAQQYTLRGAAGYVWHDGRYRTLAAVYPLRDEAQSVRRQLHEKHDVDSYLYQIDLPAIRLRLSGMNGQLDILEAAFLHANDLIAELQRISVAMDRQEANADEALETLHALKNQMQTVVLRLHQRFASPRHAAVEGMIACLEGYTAFCGELSQQENAVALGMKIKRQTLASLHKLKQVYDTLSHT